MSSSPGYNHQNSSNNGQNMEAGDPPPLMIIDQPNPPNIVISNDSNCASASVSGYPISPTSPDLLSSPNDKNSIGGNGGNRVYNESNRFLLDTHQIIAASRTDPDLLLAGCSSKEDVSIEDVDLDKMYLEAMMEDCKSAFSR